VQNIYHGNWRVWVLKLVLRYPVRPSDPHWPVARAEKQDIKVTDNGAKHGAVDEPTQSERSSCVIKPGPHQQQCRSNVRLCCQKRQQCRTSFALKFRPFDKVERCFDIVAGVDRAEQPENLMPSPTLSSDDGITTKSGPDNPGSRSKQPLKRSK